MKMHRETGPEPCISITYASHNAVKSPDTNLRPAYLFINPIDFNILKIRQERVIQTRLYYAIEVRRVLILARNAVTHHRR